jgi:ankyrin repeat protein
LDYGANPNQQGLLGYTPLHCAVIENNIECAKLLLEHGANVNIQPNVTAFTVYLQSYSNKILDGLFMRGLSGRRERMPEDYAIGFTALHFVCHSKHEALITLLLSHNADLSIRDEYNRTPLDFVNEWCQLEPRGDWSPIRDLITNNN